MADRKIVQCIASFHSASDSGPRVISAGDLYFADDPIVKGRESLFGDVKVKSSATSAQTRTPVSSTEEATATPGKRRSLTRRDDKPELETKPEVKDEKGGEV